MIRALREQRDDAELHGDAERAHALTEAIVALVRIVRLARAASIVSINSHPGDRR